MIAAIPFPETFNSEIFPNLGFGWYGLLYVVAIAIAYVLFRYQTKKNPEGFNADLSFSFFFWGTIGLILGARIFGTLVYSPSGDYWRQPWLIFWPFDPATGTFSAFRGMSFFGGLIGAIAATLLYSMYKRLDYLDWADAVAAGVPFGYVFGRLANFINAELYGRITTSPLGMIFPNDQPFSAREQWVQDIAHKTGIELSSMNAMVNLPRHPSQLYEALFEGVILGLILWFWARKYRPFKGFTLGVYLIGYGFFRFFLEYFRMPDEGLGYVINLSGKKDLPIYLLSTPWAFSLGQVFCLATLIAGGVLLAVCGYRAQPKTPEGILTPKQ
jgi:phosphatidylglycerol---prolipoprotein diacylglyceryl transferase